MRGELSSSGFEFRKIESDLLRDIHTFTRSHVYTLAGQKSKVEGSKILQGRPLTVFEPWTLDLRP